jgi:hypothetical protein
MNEIMVKWNQIYTEGIILSTTTKIYTLLFADDQVITADSKDICREEYSHCKT